MNSNAPEPARSSLVGHPPINASSIALTGITMHPRPSGNNREFQVTHRRCDKTGENCGKTGEKPHTMPYGST
jgi:hypothetical protein